MLTVTIEGSPSPADLAVVREGLGRHNASRLTAPPDVRFAIFLRDEAGAVRGGVISKAGRGWLHIGQLWVDPALRGQGHGTRLMAAVEAEGRRQGCHGAYLDTFSYQARPFYERLGYEVFGTLENFPGEHARYFMRKAL